MKFKRVDKSTVRCIISQNEIEERGLKIEDLIRNGDKAQEFLNEVVDMAEEEVGFKMTSGIQAVQAAFLPNHDVVFTFSDNVENIGMNHALDQLKDMMSEEDSFDTNRIDEIRDLEGKEQADAFAGLMEEIRQKKDKERETGLDEQPEEDFGDRQTLITVVFDDLKDGCTFCRHLCGLSFCRESLYKCGREYALILDTAEIGKEEMAAIYMQASEYAKSFTRKQARAYYIEEHEVCILKDEAVSHLKDL